MELISPSNLIYGIKGYNDLPEVTEDTIPGGNNIYSIHMDVVEALDEDVQSAYDANRMYLLYKLNLNTYNGSKDFNSYSKAGQRIHGRIYDEKDKKIEKKLQVILKDAAVSRGRDEEDKIRTLENYLKENFGLIESNAPALSDFEFMIENSVYSSNGATYLTANLLKKMGVTHELVLTSDRFSLPFDKDYECYLFLSEAIIFIPSIDMYLAPGEPYLRLGVTPQQSAGNYGLFISEVKVGDFESAISEVKAIPPTNDKSTHHDLDISVDLATDLYQVPIHYKVSQSGYYAQYLQPIYQYLALEQQEEIIEDQFKYFDENAVIKNVTVKNERSYNFGKQPMVMEADLIIEKFTESLGENILFKIGMLIGPQAEMYEDVAANRMSDVVTDFARGYERIISIKLPEGYTVSGLDKLNIDHSYSDDEGHELGFTSEYTLEGDMLSVKVIEFYKNQQYPKELFETYKEVINAAADFNKLSIVLKKI